MKHEKKMFLLGIVVGTIFSGSISAAILLIKGEKTNSKTLGSIVVYPDDFDADQLYLQLNCSLDDLKATKYAFFKIIHDKNNKYVKVKEKYAQS